MGGWTRAPAWLPRALHLPNVYSLHMYKGSHLRRNSRSTPQIAGLDMPMWLWTLMCQLMHWTWHHLAQKGGEQLLATCWTTRNPQRLGHWAVIDAERLLKWNRLGWWYRCIVWLLRCNGLWCFQCHHY